MTDLYAPLLEVWILQVRDAASPPAISDLAALIQPIGFGVGYWRMEAMSQRWPNHSLTIAAGQVVGVGLLSWIWLLKDSHMFPGISTGPSSEGLGRLYGELVSAVQSWQIIATMLWTGAIATGLTVYGETAAMTKISATEATILFSIEPVCGAVFARIYLGEILSFRTLIGAGFIFFACIWNALGELTDQKNPQTNLEDDDFQRY